RHSLLRPVSIHVPSAPSESALVAEPIEMSLPAALSGPQKTPRLNLTPAVSKSLTIRASLAANEPAVTVLPGEAVGDPIALERLTTRTALATANSYDPRSAVAVI